MTVKNVQAQWTGEGFLISGLQPQNASEQADSRSWKAAKLDDSRYLLFTDRSDFNPSTASGMAICSSAMLYDVLIGMNHRRWSGMVLVDMGFARKKLFFNAGECVFAASDLMDDRLGEVIYREAVISMEQLTQFAVQVDRKNKFGQVLIRSGDFSNTDLWNALKTQVREIFRSVFLVERCYIEVHSSVAPVEVAFEEGTESILESAFSYGSQFRAFCARMNPDETRVSPGSLVESNAINPGTFIGDVLELCKDSPTVKDVIERSKLNRLNTLAVLQRLFALGQISLEGLSAPTAARVEAGYSNLKAIIDGYHVLHQLVSSACGSSGLSMPNGDLSEFALGLNTDGCSAIFLDREGALTPDSVSSILQQCATNSHRISYFQYRLEALTRYLLQLAGDFLPADLAAKVKKEFREIVA